MATCRFFTGVFQVFISIFAPIWCDCHGPEDKKTTWITSIIVATPGGMVTGYLMTAVIISSGGEWAWSFFIQVILLVPIAIYLGCIDRSLLEVNQRNDSSDDENNAIIQPDSENPQGEDSPTNGSTPVNKSKKVDPA